MEEAGEEGDADRDVERSFRFVPRPDVDSGRSYIVLRLYREMGHL